MRLIISTLILVYTGFIFSAEEPSNESNSEVFKQGSEFFKEGVGYTYMYILYEGNNSMDEATQVLSKIKNVLSNPEFKTISDAKWNSPIPETIPGQRVKDNPSFILEPDPGFRDQYGNVKRFPTIIFFVKQSLTKHLVDGHVYTNLKSGLHLSLRDNIKGFANLDAYYQPWRTNSILLRDLAANEITFVIKDIDSFKKIRGWYEDGIVNDHYAIAGEIDRFSGEGARRIVEKKLPFAGIFTQKRDEDLSKLKIGDIFSPEEIRYSDDHSIVSLYSSSSFSVELGRQGAKEPLTVGDLKAAFGKILSVQINKD